MKDGERDDVDGAVRMEHGEAVTYIVYVRVYVYRLIAIVYIIYLSARTGRSPSRLQQTPSACVPSSLPSTESDCAG